MIIYKPGQRHSCQDLGKRFAGGISLLLFFNIALFSIILLGCALPPLATRGLRAEYPKQYSPSSEKFMVVDSLRPTLRWESFPTERDLNSTNAKELHRITDVTYQLRIIARDIKGWSYRKEKLEVPYHSIEVTLQPLTKYLWTVRSCFRLDGQLRCTEWGALSDWELSAVYHPNFSSFRFQTPAH